jgi:hypothetical protein
VAPAALGAAGGGSVSIAIDGFTSRQDGGNAIGGGIRLALPDPPFRLEREVSGEIRVPHARVIDPSGWGVAVSRWARGMPGVVFDDVSVMNPNAKGDGRADFGWSPEEDRVAARAGFVVALLRADRGAGSRRVEFRHCRGSFYLHSASDTRIDAAFDDSP